jgi:hypothetical protein
MCGDLSRGEKFSLSKPPDFLTCARVVMLPLQLYTIKKFLKVFQNFFLSDLTRPQTKRLYRK